MISQVMILSPDFIVTITSHFQTLIYTLFRPPIGISSRNHFRPHRLGRPFRLLCTDSACNNHRSSFTVRHHFIFVRQDSFSNGHNYRQVLKFLQYIIYRRPTRIASDRHWQNIYFRCCTEEYHKLKKNLQQIIYYFHKCFTIIIRLHFYHTDHINLTNVSF